MYIIMLGPPGAGKGTQAEKLAEKLDLSHMSSGDILREAVEEGSPSGKQAEDFMKEGKLVPDPIILELLRVKIEKERGGFILDGFPRNLEQARKLDGILKEENREVDLVLNLRVNEEALINRLSARLICSRCNRVYREGEASYTGGICENCGARLLRRNDDNPLVIKNRMKTYLSSTYPLIEYYRKRGILRDIQGDGFPEEVLQKIMIIIQSPGHKDTEII